MSTIRPVLGKIRRANGVAGQFAYTVPVTYPGESTNSVTFVGDAYTYGVIMVTPEGHQIPVRDPGRCGDKLNPSWVRKFFGVSA